MTETITAARIVARDVAGVTDRLTYGASSAPARALESWYGGHSMRYVATAAIHLDLETASNTQRPARIRGSREQAPPERRVFPAEAFLGLFPIDEEDMVMELRPGHEVSTQFGTFVDCWRLRFVGGSAWGVSRWFCAGVGYVRIESTGCHSMGRGGYDTVAEIVAWGRAD